MSFELHGPFPGGTEMQPRDPYDGSGLAGRMSHDNVKEVLSLLDPGKSPREYVQQHGKEVEVVADD